jgi:hypothetical protein
LAICLGWGRFAELILHNIKGEHYVVVVWSLQRPQSSTAVRPSSATFQSPGCCLGHKTTGQGLHLTTPDPQGAGLKNLCSEREGVGAPWYHHQVIQQTQGPDFQSALAPYLPHSGPGSTQDIVDYGATYWSAPVDKVNILEVCPLFEVKCQQTWPEDLDTQTKLWGTEADLRATAPVKVWKWVRSR